MKRRSFLKRSLPTVTFLPGVVNGMAVRAFGGASPLLQSLLPPVDTDHVLVIVQLNGGNDGLNTVVPLSTYGDYYNARTNVAIAQSKVLKLNNYELSGLHPAMTGLRALYNEGKVAIVQAAGYPQPNFSHFRATDIWMSGSSSTQVLNTGWGGRYLNMQYPNYPSNYPTTSMPDPLAIQIGSVTSLTCQGPVVNMGMSITDPTSFYNLINGVQDPAPNNRMGYELTYIRDVAQQTNQYAQRVKAAATAVTQQAPYPSANSLADQLKIVARLIKGGLKTRIYMVSMGGFDTHASQVVSTDTATGTHANLLSNLSNAIKAFMDDVKYLGIEDRVLGMTFSEFGRRIRSNASGGTDHGSAAPLFLFGKGVRPGVYGSNPAIPAQTSVNDNIPFQYDFRSVYASILKDWFCVPDSDLQMILLQNFQQINLLTGVGCKSVPGPDSGIEIVSNYPNPFVSATTISFETKGGHTLIQILNGLGQLVQTLIDQDYPVPGRYTAKFESFGLASGVYYARLQNGPVQQVRTMLKAR